jgi:hypothetical protein
MVDRVLRMLLKYGGVFLRSDVLIDCVLLREG